MRTQFEKYIYLSFVSRRKFSRNHRRSIQGLLLAVNQTNDGNLTTLTHRISPTILDRRGDQFTIVSMKAKYIKFKWSLLPSAPTKLITERFILGW